MNTSATLELAPAFIDSRPRKVTAEQPRGLPVAQSIRVFIAEDHRITLWGLQRLIESAQPRMRVVGTALSRSELVAHPALAEADLVLMDLDLDGEDSCSALADVQRRCPGHVLILTGAGDAQRHRTAMVQGARGVVHKSESADTILRAIEKVHSGEIWLNGSLLGEVMGLLTGRAPIAAPQSDDERRIASLTPREREIVQVMAGHAGSKLLAVAEVLRLSENTLRNHLTTIYSKLAVRGRLELYVYASEHGLAAADGQRPAK